MSYLARHWRGELSLPVSFWVNNGLLALPAGFAIGALAAWITATGDFLRGGAIAILVSWPLLALFGIWAGVGGWRAANTHVREGGGVLWARLAQLVLALGLLNVVVATLFDFAPRVPEWLRMARGIDPIGHLQAELTADGRKLRLAGPIGLGDGARVTALMADARSLRVVELESPGGRLKEAERIAKALRERGADTRATGTCASACTVIHLAGQRRQLMPGARLGYHRAHSGTINPVLDRLANQEMAAIYRDAGLPEPILRRTLATPAHTMWFPGRDELVHAGLVSVPERPLDIDLPAGAGASAAEFGDALRANDSWLALDKRFPGTLDAATAALVQARATAAGAEPEQLAAQQVAAPLVPQLLATAGPETLELFARLFADQLAAARTQGGDACAGVLAWDVAARRRLDATLARREAVWLVDATLEAPRRHTTRGLSAIENEVLVRRLGPRAPALLQGLWRPGQPRTARDCDRALETLALVAALPGAERRLALRVLFE